MKLFLLGFLNYVQGTKWQLNRALRAQAAGSVSEKKALEVLEKYGFGSLSEQEKAEMVRDMLECATKRHYMFSEYFMYRFYERSDEERFKFGSFYWATICYSQLNRARNRPIFDVKYYTAKKFAKYFKRETIAICTRFDRKKLARFLERHGSVIVKPMSSLAGRDVDIFTLGANEDANELASKLIAQYCKGRKCAIVEELVEQDERMKVLHPQSVNTLRVVTIRLNDRVVIFHPRVRVGRGGSVVDNCGKGGIMGLLDPETGVVEKAEDEMGNSFTIHPDTQVPIVGFQVPEYDKAIALAKELATVVPSNRLTGWDLALSTKGWVLIEANRNPSWFHQMTSQIGCKEEVKGYLREIGITDKRTMNE